MARLAAGTMLAGYRIERFLGQGGMGVVYLASQLSLDRPVALKLIAPERAADAAFRERFLRESRLAASLDHPNVVPVHEAGEDAGVLFVAMRYVEGADLGAVLRAAGALDGARAARIVAQVGDALDAAHARRLVHRDVKPANVLVADPGGADHCYLTDFGLTKQTATDETVSAMTQTGTVLGTLQYMAPEQIRGGAVDARTDVYALGCVLHELLAGRPPFVRDTEVATMFAHLTEPPAALGGPFDEIIERALEKAPARRFQSAGDLGRAALRAAAETGAGAATARPGDAAPGTAAAALGAATAASGDAAPGAATAGARPASRRRRTWIAAIAAVAALAAGGAAAALLLADGDSGGDRDGGGGGAGGLRVAQRVKLGGVPLTATAFDNRIWISLEDEPRLAVLDPSTGAVTQSAEFGGSVSTTAAGSDTLWVGDFGDSPEDGRGSVVPVDPATGRKRAPVRTIEPYEMVADGDSLWISDLSDYVQRVDVATGKAGERIRFDRPFDLVLLDGRVWVVGNGLGQLVPFDARTGARRGRPIGVGARPLTATTTGGAIWVVTEPGRLVRVVPGQARQDETAIGPPDSLRSIAADAEALWIVDGRGVVTRVDATAPRRQATVKVGGELLDAEPYAGGAWVTAIGASEASAAVRVAPRAE